MSATQARHRELFAKLVELSVLKPSLATVLVAKQNLVHPELGDGLQLPVIELGNALCRQGCAAKVEFLTFVPELDIDARALGSSQFLRSAAVRRA